MRTLRRRASVALAGIALLVATSAGAIWTAENTTTGQSLMFRLADEAGR